MNQKNALPNYKNKAYGAAWSIYDNESINFLNTIKSEKGNINQFLTDYKNWIGLDFTGYSNVNFSAGTTETFDKFYHRHLGKRLRIFKGEYFYHQIMGRNYFEMEWLEDSEIKENDFVVMSCPFADTGNMPKNFYSILESCDKLDVPVLLDLAYINISNLMNINLNYNCIKTITTSLSKVFPIEHYRIGIRFDRDYIDDTLNAYNQNNYVNLYSVHIGHSFIKKFSNDWLYKKYQAAQLSICKKLNVKPSDCVIFGLADQGYFDEYHRGGSVNRLCFSRIWDGRINAETN